MLSRFAAPQGRDTLRLRRQSGPTMARTVVVCALLAVACQPQDRGEVDAGSDGVVGGDAGAPADPPPFTSDRVRRGTARPAAGDAPLVPDGTIPIPPDGVVVVDVGAIEVDDDGMTGTIELDVDDAVAGVTVVVVGQPDAHVILGHAEAPDGAAVIDDAAPDPATPGLAQATSLSRGFPGPFFSPGRVLPAPHVGAFALPSTADLPLSPGLWRFRVGHHVVAFDDAGRPTVRPLARPVRVVVVVRTTPPSPGRIDLALHFTGSGGLTADAASRSPVLADVLARVGGIFADAGIVVGDVAFADLADGAALRTLVLEPPLCEGDDLAALMERGRSDRVNVFFVDRFECGAIGPFLLGLSPGIPGVPWAGGTRSSGIVVAGTFLSTTPERLAVTIAHELGHHLGLFHSQENDRFGAALYDNIADTDEAPGSRENLMFFDVSRISREALSPGQAATLQRGPVVLP